MKKFFFAAAVAALFLGSCTKEPQITQEQASYVKVIDEDTALRNFSVALSKAVCSEQSVREFLKKEALKQVDNDYDVFYPFVKDSQVDGSRTFSDVISQYLEGDIKEIETAVPTLNILVPDMTWLDPQGFCAERWDTSDQRASVTYKRSGSNDKELFVNGYAMGEIESGTIPGGTVLVVKSSERIVADVPTKGAEPTYRFVDDAFDASKNEPLTKDIRYTGKYTFEWYASQNEEDSSDSISGDILYDINPDIMVAFNLFNWNRNACHNDYIYYGMTSSDEVGVLNTDVRPMLFRFKVNPDSFDALFDDTEGNDRRFSDCLDTDDNGGRRPEPSVEQVYDALWAEGALEIAIDVYGNDSNNKIVQLDKHVYDVKAKDLFTVKDCAISKETWWSTMFKWYITWQYKMNRRDGSTLASKWYYPKDRIVFPTLDLVENSSYYVHVYEIDSKPEVDKVISITSRRSSSNSNAVTKSENGSVKKQRIGWSSADETVKTENIKIRWREDNDEMGTFQVRYSDKCISDSLSTGFYNVPSYTTGSRFSCTILPVKY